ncbi:MAG: type II secretion system protein GspL [Paracoccaceae bacterium]
MVEKADISAAPDMPFAAPTGVALVPTEQVLLLTVALPDMPATQRRAAIGFAVEDQIARPLDDVHVVLGPALPQVTGAPLWLAAIIGRDVLAGMTESGKARLLPDVLMLPVPAVGQWSVFAHGARVLVRTADGAGFATTAKALPYFHLAAARPGIVLFGGGYLDPQFTVLARAEMPAAPDLSLRRFDLNTARAQTDYRKAAQRWRPFAAVLACAALAQIGLLAVDVWALARVKAAQVAELEQALTTLGQPINGDLDRAIAAVAARAGGTQAPQFVSLTARAFGAMTAEQGRITASDLRYVADQNSLILQLQAPDIASLQGVETALGDAGFAVTAGAATTSNGLAEQQLSLSGSAP